VQSAMVALVYLGAIYASCAWFGTVEDYELRFSEADQIRSWIVVSPPTLSAARQQSRSITRDDSLEHSSLEYRGRSETTAGEHPPTI
jgi:hypothetical protein